MIEIMIALVVFTVASVTLVKTATLSVRQSGQVESRIQATWVAENEITRLRLLERSDENYPGTGTQRQIYEQGDNAWEIETRIEATENDFVRRVTVHVTRDGTEEPAASLTGFLGRH